MDFQHSTLPTLYQNFIHISRYSRWLPEKKRRETWDETVSRLIDYLKEERGTMIEDDIFTELYNGILTLEFMPSMRLMMTAGMAHRQDNMAGYNCSYSAVDKVSVFSDALYILMCGCGFGFSVERQYIKNLPVIPRRLIESNEVFKTNDDKVGWAETLKRVLDSLYNGLIPKWDLTGLRPKGARLKTMGGRSSGPEPFDDLLRFIVRIFRNATGRQLNSIECHDILCKIAEIVVVGGTRRCIAKDSLVRTKHGNILKEGGNYTKIQDIQPGVKVYTSCGWKTVSNVFEQGKQETITITHEYGNISCTKNHRLATLISFDNKSHNFEYSWSYASNLIANSDELIYYEPKTGVPKKSKIIDISANGVCETFDIEVSPTHAFVCENILVHNSASISLTNLTDDRMRDAKKGQFWETAPYRSLANISVAYTEKPEIGRFMKEWVSLYESKSGERGIFNRAAAQKQAGMNGRRDPEHDFGTNPCSEIILRSRQCCNLTEVIVRDGDTFEDLKRKVRLATIMGTIQATFTGFRCVGDEWRRNCEIERLLGVSLTGIYDHEVLRQPSEKLKTWLTELRDYAIQVNREYAEKLGINQAMAITTVKPSGTVSQLTDTASGIHPRHAKHYIRTVRANRNDPLTKLMKRMRFPYEKDLMTNENYVFSFPIKSPEHSTYKDDISAIEHLEMWKFYQTYWCEHKPSITVSIKEYEWLQVGAFVYENFDMLSGVSFLPATDMVYQQAPYQEITEEEYNELCQKMPKNVDWSELKKYEKDDMTAGTKTFACSAGFWEFVDLDSTPTGIKNEEEKEEEEKEEKTEQETQTVYDLKEVKIN